MNRKERRKAKALAKRFKRFEIARQDIDKRYDIQVDAKHGNIVMVFANAGGAQSGRGPVARR